MPKDEGFSVIELLIYMTILGALSFSWSLAKPKYRLLKSQADGLVRQIRLCQAEALLIGSSLALPLKSRRLPESRNSEAEGAVPVCSAKGVILRPKEKKAVLVSSLGAVQLSGASTLSFYKTGQVSPARLTLTYPGSTKNCTILVSRAGPSPAKCS